MLGGLLGLDWSGLLSAGRYRLSSNKVLRCNRGGCTLCGRSIPELGVQKSWSGVGVSRTSIFKHHELPSRKRCASVEGNGYCRNRTRPHGRIFTLPASAEISGTAGRGAAGVNFDFKI